MGYDGSIPGGAHWRAPALMVGSLLVGTGLAIGNHFFYKSLEFTAVSSEPVKFAGWSFSSQQVNTAAGTAFAFLVKASLVLSISTVYVQLFFHTITTRASRIGKIDRWYSALSDIVSWFSTAIHWRTPLLPIVALTAWLLPIASIITPATLSVTFDRILPAIVEPYFVPEPALVSLALSDFLVSPADPDDEDSRTFRGMSFFRPSHEATRIAQAAAAAGSILPIRPPETNSSWQLSTELPRLVCDDMNDTLKTAVKDNLKSIMAMVDWDGGNMRFPESMFEYLAWSSVHGKPELPFIGAINASQNNSSGTSASSVFRLTGTSPGINSIGLDDVEGRQIFMAVLPRIIENSSPLSLEPFVWNLKTDLDKAMAWALEGATMLQCTFTNAQYDLEFRYEGIVQQQHIEILDVHEAPFDWDLAQWNMLSAMYSFVDDQGELQLAGPVTIEELGADSGIDAFALRSWSYQAIVRIVRGLLLGAGNTLGMLRSDSGLRAVLSDSSGSHQYQSQVLSTSLVETLELHRLQQGQAGSEDILAELNANDLALDQARSLMRPSIQGGMRQHLKDAIEELVFNMTMSLASSPTFLYNSSSPVAPPPVNVTIDRYGNIYSYASDKLWLAYGLAIGITALNVAIGLHTIFTTRSSFTANFCTIIRAARNSNISTDIQEDGMPGKDPLPKHVQEAEFGVRLTGSSQLQMSTVVQYTKVNTSEMQREEMNVVRSETSSLGRGLRD